VRVIVALLVIVGTAFVDISAAKEASADILSAGSGETSLASARVLVAC